MQVVLKHPSDASEILLDTPYQFEEQRMFRMPGDHSAADVVMNPGDTLTTTCRFHNEGDVPLQWGERTEDEMCFLTVWAWPAGNLHNDSPDGPMLGFPQDQTCLDSGSAPR